MPWCPRCGTGLSQMEMNEGYQDREDPGLTVRFPLVDRPGEALLVWTTTPWTLTSNVAAAVGEDLRYVRVRQGDDRVLGRQGRRSRPRVQGAVQGRGGGRRARSSSGGATPGRSTSCRRSATRSREARLRAPRRRLGRGRRGRGHGHRPHRARLRRRGLPAGQGSSGCRSSGRSTRTAATCAGLRLADAAWRPRRSPSGSSTTSSGAGFFYHLEPYTHRYPHCWRCGTPLLFRLVDEWFISMGEVYDVPREQLTTEQVDASLRYQIMEVVDGIRWIPDFGYDRELDWLRNMHDWMISKKRYWGLALPIYDCERVRDVRGHRRARGAARARGRGLGRVRGPHARTGRGWTRSGSPARRAARRSSGSRTSATRGSTPGSCRSRTLHFREDPEYWAKWFPADFITESFPGQFRNWFYSMLAMSTVLKRTEPFKTIFGYALVFGEDGRPMHKSWGNAIEFDEAADRMGVDVMRWMFAKARPEDNILFGWHAADEARRELLVLWNVYAFFVTYARLAGWTPRRGDRRGDRPRRAAWPVLDRWILSRAAGLAADVGARLDDVDALGATRAISAFIDDLSTWYLRRSRDRMRAGADPADRDAAFATLHAALVTPQPDARPDPAVPVRDAVPEPRRVGDPAAARQRPPDRAGRPTTMAPFRDEPLERAMALVRGAVDLARTLRAQAGLRARQPLATAWLAVPDRGLALRRRAARAVRGRAQRASGSRSSRDGSALVERRGEAAAAEDREAARRRDPRGHGRRPRGRRRVPRRRLGDAGRRDARRGRGRDPGDAAARDRGRGPRRPRRRARHRAHAGAARRGRRPRAPARDPGPAQGGRAGPRRPDRAVGRRASPRRSSRTSRPSPARRSPTSCGARRPPDGVPVASVRLEAGEARIALRRVGDGA